MNIKLSPLAPKKPKKISCIDGIRISITHCGLKKNNKQDLVLIKFDKPSKIYGVFTSSKTPGEPIIWNKSIIKHGKVSAILINSGNANVFNGREGRESLEKIVKNLAKNLNIEEKEIYVASTGIIGVPLDHKKIIKKIPFLVKNLRNDPSTWLKAANAIRTTDTFAKIHNEKSKLKKNLIVNGIAKGSGMIAPNMATMLAFVFTNAVIGKNFENYFKRIVNSTFNSITVDGDTSTSDMVLFVSVEDEKFKLKKQHEISEFFFMLEKVMTDMCHDIVKDGEGASKFVSINVKGAKSNLEAKKVAFSIANSPLFKTAIAGSDSNWGRIIMAIGKTNISLDPKKITISFGKDVMIKNSSKTEKNFSDICKYLKKKKIDIYIDLGISSGSATVWTCDLTKNYIKINSEYRS